MYLLAHSVIGIACSKERAFAYAADLHNFPRWFPGVREVTSDDGRPFDVLGKQYRETVAVPLRGERAVVIRVTEVAASRRLVTEGSLAVLRPRMEIDVEATETGACRVSFRMTSRNTSLLPRWLVLPWARRVMTGRAERGLHRLREILERG